MHKTQDGQSAPVWIMQVDPGSTEMADDLSHTQHLVKDGWFRVQAFRAFAFI